MYFLGWLAFFQIIFLPGFIFLELLKIKTKTLIEKIIFAFGLSLIINFVLVFLLTLLKLYQPIMIYIIFIFEIIIFLATIVNKKMVFRFSPSLILMISLLVIIRFLLPFIQNLSLKSVFLTGDVIDSWNVWAGQWANNKIPVATYHYPQLIPTNWSLTYVFMQTTAVELFAKLLMPLFALAILLIFFDLGKFIGLIMTGFLFHYYFDNSWLRDGQVDIAFAFFSFLSFYCFLLYQKYKEKQYLFLMLLFALGSFLTKQLGFYIVLLALISPTRWFLAQPNRLKFIKKHVFLVFLLLFIFLLFVVTAGWYFLKWPEIKTAYNPELIYQAAMTGKIINFSLLARIIQSLKILMPNIKGIFIVGTVTLLSLFCLRNRQSRQLLGFVVFPLFIFWLMFLNYDQRNLTVIFPYLGYIGASGLMKLFPLQLFEYSNNHSNNNKISFSAFHIFLVLIFFVVFTSLFVNNSYLLQQQTEGKKQIGIPELNSRLYDYYSKHGFSGKISTSYYRLCNLPKIGKHCFYSPTTIPTGKYYLYPKGFLKDKLKSKKIILQYRDWVLVKSNFD